MYTATNFHIIKLLWMEETSWDSRNLLRLHVCIKQTLLLCIQSYFQIELKHKPSNLPMPVIVSNYCYLVLLFALLSPGNMVKIHYNLTSSYKTMHFEHFLSHYRSLCQSFRIIFGTRHRSISDNPNALPTYANNDIAPLPFSIYLINRNFPQLHCRTNPL